jgi:hypothetical protein
MTSVVAVRLAPAIMNRGYLLVSIGVTAGMRSIQEGHFPPYIPMGRVKTTRAVLLYPTENQEYSLFRGIRCHSACG